MIEVLIVMGALIVMELMFLVFIHIDRNHKSEVELEQARIMSETEKLKFYSEFDFDKIDTRLDKFIKDAGQNYKMNNFEYKDPEEVYLNEEVMNTMIKAMVNEVYERLTPAIIDVMRLSYKIEHVEDIVHILYNKCRDYVLQYSLEVNADIE